jgi:hypothetical protein
MKDAELDPLLGELGKHIENRSEARTTTSPAAGTHTRILHHDILEIRGRHPDASFRHEHSLHDFLVVLTVGEQA